MSEGTKPKQQLSRDLSVVVRYIAMVFQHTCHQHKLPKIAVTGTETLGFGFRFDFRFGFRFRFKLR